MEKKKVWKKILEELYSLKKFRKRSKKFLEQKTYEKILEKIWSSKKF